MNGRKMLVCSLTGGMVGLICDNYIVTVTTTEGSPMMCCFNAQTRNLDEEKPHSCRYHYTLDKPGRNWLLSEAPLPRFTD